ncbi:MAG: hypothetical protein JWP56_1559 [Aeromicrobium sp.]|jgi:hypothetical protein|nr:hypothetical protein [Aeromicrobium sp.]
MRARFDDLRARPAVADADLEALWDDAEVLAAALVARQDGLEVTVVERSPTRREVVARTLRALDSGGILVTVGLGPVEGRLDLGDLLHGGKTLRGCIEGDLLAIEDHRAARVVKPVLVP